MLVEIKRTVAHARARAPVPPTTNLPLPVPLPVPQFLIEQLFQLVQEPLPLGQGRLAVHRFRELFEQALLP